MHEIALQTNEERLVPSSAEALRDPIPGLGDNLAPAHINALSSCLTAIDEIFKIFLSLDESTIRCLPIFNLVRVSYAVVVLLKIYFSASSPNSELGKVIDKDEMKVAEYIVRLHQKFKDTAAGGKSRPADKFQYVLGIVGNWFRDADQRRGRQNEDESKDTLKSTQPSRNDSITMSSNSQDNLSKPNTSYHQQPQMKSPPGYNAASTPLQVLSEIATGNRPPQNPHNSGAPSAPNASAPNYYDWMSSGPHLPFGYDINSGLPTSTPTGNTTVGSAAQSLNMPWLASPFGGNMNYLTMGDGLEQAMQFTLTGFGDTNPGNSVSYENSSGMMAQNDPNLMNLPNDFSGNVNAFGF